MRNKVIFPFILLMLSMNYFFTSCEKNTDCTAKIICVDANGTALQGAGVQLYANVKTSTGGTVVADIKAQGVTDGAGTVSFLFKLPAIYDITSTLTAASTATSGPATVTLTGTGIIKLEEGKTVEKTVTLR